MGDSSDNGLNSSRSNSTSNSSNEELGIGRSERSSPCNDDDITYNQHSHHRYNPPTINHTQLQNHQQNSCAVDLSANFYLNGEIFDEADEQPSNEFAQADDDFEQIDGVLADQDQVKSSDEEFTYSYGDVLSTANRVDEASGKLEDKQKVTIMSFGKEMAAVAAGAVNAAATATSTDCAADVSAGGVVKVHDEMLNLNIHRLPGKKI